MNVAAWLVDDFLEKYVSWREASEALQSAYEQWRDAERSQRALAFAAYRAALDREEHAAGALQERTTRIAAQLAEARDRVVPVRSRPAER